MSPRADGPSHWRSTSREPDAADRIVREADERLGQLDVLVNNAGTARRRDLDEVPDEDWYAAWELNVMAPMRLMRAAAPSMGDRGWGRIVNVSSSSGKRPSAATPEYSVAKAAELSLSRLFADRYAAQGVLINAICPGAVKSELWTEDGGLLDQVMEMEGLSSREEALEAAAAGAPDRPAGRDRRGRGRHRLPLLRAGLVHLRGGVERRWRSRPDHHLS